VKKRPSWLRPRLTRVIAEREYRLVTKDRKRRRVLLRFGKPYRAEDGAYYCGFQIDGLAEEEGVERARYLSGVDTIQALFSAMQMATTELLWTDAYKEGRLTWDGFYDLGLPVADGDRRRIRKDPEAARIMKEVAAMLAHDGSPARRSSTGSTSSRRRGSTRRR